MSSYCDTTFSTGGARVLANRLPELRWAIGPPHLRFSPTKIYSSFVSRVRPRVFRREKHESHFIEEYLGIGRRDYILACVSVLDVACPPFHQGGKTSPTFPSFCSVSSQPLISNRACRQAFLLLEPPRGYVNVPANFAKKNCILTTLTVLLWALSKCRAILSK